MKPNYHKCPRCLGGKKMYQLGNGYSAVNFGGKQVDCPMCLGEGEVKTLEEALKDVKNKHEGSSLGSFLKEEGMLESVEKVAIKNAVKRKGRPKKELNSEL